MLQQLNEFDAALQRSQDAALLQARADTLQASLRRLAGELLSALQA